MDENKSVEFRGTGQGLAIRVHLHHDVQQIKDIIQQRINENPSFYKGATIADITCESLSETVKKELEQWLATEHGMVINSKEISGSSGKSKQEPDNTSPPRQPAKALSLQASNEYGTKFVEGTLRSGQIIEHPGDVVVIGDVNPGAEISAGGNIVVMGILRGIAHAGVNGKTDAFVAANVLQPTQLRIHQTITRSPDESLDRSKNPEIAKLKDQIICVDPF